MLYTGWWGVILEETVLPFTSSQIFLPKENKGAWRPREFQRFSQQLQKLFCSKKNISQMRPGVRVGEQSKPNRDQVMLPSTLYLPGWGNAFRLALISLRLLFPPYGQLEVWAMKGKLAALCSVCGNVYFWPRLYQRSKAIMAMKELLELLCSVMRRCSDAGCNC